MKRPLEVASGLGVFWISFVSLAATLKMFFYYQQSPEKVPLFSIVSLGVTGLSVILSFIGAFILLSWANKRG
jgi:hypothetical protein